MKCLVVDIEAIPDPMFPPAVVDPTKKEGLRAPPYWQVVTIGCALMESYALSSGNRYWKLERLGVVGGRCEHELLRGLVEYLQSGNMTLVTFNGRGFDLPVIVARCFRYAIPFPWYYARRDIRYRYSPEGHLDLMDFLADYGASKSSSLDVWAKLCGMPGKVGVDGSQVEGLVAAGRQAEVDNYCLCDVAQTAAVFLRTELLRGTLAPEGYVESERLLAEVIHNDARLKALNEALQEKVAETAQKIEAVLEAVECGDG